jgi:hypothetical protein
MEVAVNDALGDHVIEKLQHRLEKIDYERNSNLTLSRRDKFLKCWAFDEFGNENHTVDRILTVCPFCYIGKLHNRGRPESICLQDLGTPSWRIRVSANQVFARNYFASYVGPKSSE